MRRTILNLGAILLAAFLTACIGLQLKTPTERAGAVITGVTISAQWLKAVSDFRDENGQALMTRAIGDSIHRCLTQAKEVANTYLTVSGNISTTALGFAEKALSIAKPILRAALVQQKPVTAFVCPIPQ